MLDFFLNEMEEDLKILLSHDFNPLVIYKKGNDRLLSEAWLDAIAAIRAVEKEIKRVALKSTYPSTALTTFDLVEKLNNPSQATKDHIFKAFYEIYCDDKSQSNYEIKIDRSELTKSGIKAVEELIRQTDGSITINIYAGEHADPDGWALCVRISLH